MPSQWNVWRLTVFLRRFNSRDRRRLTVSYFSEYGTDFSVFNSGHGVLRRIVIGSKNGFEKGTVASSVSCFVSVRVDASKFPPSPVKGGGEGGAFNRGKSRKERV